MLTKLRKKTLSSLSIFSLLLNIFQPFIITAPYFIPTQAHAEDEVVLDEEVEVVAEEEVILEESPDPIVVELTPVEAELPTPTETPEPSPEPILEKEPLPEPDLTPPTRGDLSSSHSHHYHR